MELLLRRRGARWSGWVAYTLSRSSRIYPCGLRPSDFDQTHVLSVVAQARLPWRLIVGARLQVATGRPVTMVDTSDPLATQRNNSRLPTWVELDLRVDREWAFDGWTLGAFVEVLNATVSQSVLGLHYPSDNGVPRYDQPQLLGFRWMLPSLGLRGSF
jgi:hypothetical protein